MKDWNNLSKYLQSADLNISAGVDQRMLRPDKISFVLKQLSMNPNETINYLTDIGGTAINKYIVRAGV